jgi:bacteriocin biosynthesis cyclodehydratase domain-containing protein
MLARPRIRSCFEVVPGGPALLFLLEEQRQVIFEGELYVRLAPLLDGTRGLGELSAALPDVAFPQLAGALTLMERRGCLAEAGAPPTARDAFLEALPGVPAPREAALSLRTLGTVPADALAAALSADGFTVKDDAGLRVVQTDDYLRPELAAENEAALRDARPWMLVKPVGLVAWIGPIFVPGVTGCWSCLAQRLRANRQMENYVTERSGEGGPLVTSRSFSPSTLESAVRLASLELLRFTQAQGAGDLSGRMLSMDLMERTSREHVLVRRPQCRSCGDPAAAVPRPVVIAERLKRHRADGGHRAYRPEETLARFEHHVSPILGAVTDLRPALGKYHPELTPAFVAGHNFSMGVDSVVFLRESLRGMSGGKGASPVQAKVSGLCEALERYSGLWTGDEPVQRGSYAELGAKAIHPNACMGFSDAQFAERETWNAAQAQPISRCVLVPRPFDEQLELDWTPLWSLTKNEERLLPSAYCYYGHPEFSGRWSIPDSNGCAAGNTTEEAILQGFLELVERDAVALWWYNRIPRRGVDLASFDIPYLRAIQDHYRTIGRSLWVLDITSDLGITTMACVSKKMYGPTEDLLVGFGSHFDPSVALLRAITEVNQFLPSVSHMRPDGTTVYLFGDELARHWWTTARLADLPYLAPDPKQAPGRTGDFVDPSTDDLAEDVRRCVAVAEKAGLEVLVLDQTRPDIGLNVVRVAAPGICHFWRRFGFPRLSEVPVKMGWLDRPKAPSEMNPYTIFF